MTYNQLFEYDVEILDSFQNEYLTSIGDRFFGQPCLNVSIFDVPAILEPSFLFTRDFNHSAFLHTLSTGSEVWKSSSIRDEWVQFH